MFIRNMQTSGLELAHVIFASTKVRMHDRLLYERMWATKRSIAFASVLPSDLVTRLGKVININSWISASQADILVSLLKTCLAQVIMIHGRQRKATYGQIHGNYK
jgi:hypothetical protein